MKDYTGIPHLDAEWLGWQRRATTYLEQCGIPESVDYALGYHEGAPTIYWGHRAVCVYNEPEKYLDEDTLDDMKEFFQLT